MKHRQKKSPLLGIVLIGMIIVVVYFFMNSNQPVQQKVGTLITNLPTGQVTFYLPQPPPQLGDLSKQISNSPYYNYFSTKSGSTHVANNSVSQNTTQQSNSPQTTVNVGINNQSVNSLNNVTSSSFSQVPTARLGGHIDITAKITMINPLTKVSIIPPYTWIMQISCISEWCNNDNIPTPKGHTDLTGMLFYRFQANSNFIPVGSYIAKITFISEDGNQIELETNYPFNITQ